MPNDMNKINNSEWAPCASKHECASMLVTSESRSRGLARLSEQSDMTAFTSNDGEWEKTIKMLINILLHC